MGCSSSKAVSSGDKKSNLLTLGEKNDEDIRDKYNLGGVLGSGSFGQVREATVKGNETLVRAVKMIERDNEDGEWSNKAMFVREVTLLQQIQHDNVIRYFDFYEDVHFLYVVMELCRGGEVFAKIVELKRFSEKNAANLGHQMLSAIGYIHSMRIAHRDIKAENFMLAEPSINSQVKMIDFGMSCKFDPQKPLTELCGSPHYLAPELIGQKYNHRADVWACGVLLYLLMYGHYPYDAKHPRDIMVKILTEPIRWQTKVTLSPEALNLLKSLLEHDPKKRISAADALNHQWMKFQSAAVLELPTDVIRSAHKKVTATRKQIDPKVDEVRNLKLRQIDEDYTRGIRHGQRVGTTPKEEYMSKPEFLRRENKLATAPSNQINNRRTSLQKLIGNLGGGGSGKPQGGLQAITEGGGRKEGAAAEVGGKDIVRKPVRASSMSGMPRRLSYIGVLSSAEETHLKSLYEEKRTDQGQAPAEPEFSPVLPGTSPAVEDPAETA